MPHPGHPVYAGHPGYTVPVIKSVLQGRVYHRFGIFMTVQDLLATSLNSKRNDFIKLYVLKYSSTMALGDILFLMPRVGVMGKWTELS